LPVSVAKKPLPARGLNNITKWTNVNLETAPDNRTEWRKTIHDAVNPGSRMDEESAVHVNYYCL